MEEVILDRALEAAQEAGANHTPVPLKEFHRAYQSLYPPLEAMRSLESFEALVNAHCINDRARFPDAANPAADAPWLRNPLFQVVPRKKYLLLTDKEKARFFRLLKSKDERLFQSEYRVAEVLGVRE